MFQPENPLIVQSDRTLLVEVRNPRYPELRERLARFAELLRSPEHIHTYQITPLSLWNAASTGMDCEQVLSVLTDFAKYPVPSLIEREVKTQFQRYGKLKLKRDGDALVLEVDDPITFQMLSNDKKLAPLFEEHEGHLSFSVAPLHRGEVKQLLIKKGFPVEDLAGYTKGEPLELSFRETTLEGHPFKLRKYQQESIDIFYAGGGPEGGHGVVCLPCGAGKTVVGIGAMVRAGVSTLILATNISACRQWIREILDKTDLDPELVSEYSGENKRIAPVTVATYHILTHRQKKGGPFTHFDVFHARNWGLVLYDEVHLLPAPVFRISSALQACRRLGLTATLVREDGREEDVFCLIGPKRFDMPWRELETQGFIATAQCEEVRIPLPLDERIRYANATDRARLRLAAENPLKVEKVRQLCEHHKEDFILVIGHYVDQLKNLSSELDAPLITGKTHTSQRELLYNAFRTGEIKLLVVSKVANFAIDLPDANVLIQISGTFGSRQEEAQRLGRILRPKIGIAYFYSLVSRDTNEQDFSLKRQLFLTEQGYRYQISEVPLNEEGDHLLI